MTPAPDVNWGQVLLVAISGSGILTVALMALINGVNERAKSKRDAKQKAEEASRAEEQREVDIKRANEQREADMQNAREAAEQAAAATILQYGLDSVKQLQTQHNVNIQREQVWLQQIQIMQSNVAQAEKNFTIRIDLLVADVQGLRMDNQQKDKVIASQAEEILQLRDERDRMRAILKQHGLEGELTKIDTGEVIVVSKDDPPSSSSLPGLPLN